MNARWFWLCGLLLIGTGVTGAPVTDGNIALSESELSYAFANLPKNLRDDVVTQKDKRYQTIARLIAGKRFLAEGERLRTKGDEDYQRYQYALQAAARRFFEKQFVRDLEIPDMSAIAEERFRVDFDEVGFSPEKREVAHILIKCAEDCDDKSTQDRLVEIEAQLSETDFASLARQESDDSGSAKAGGYLDLAFTRDDTRLIAAFRDAAYELVEIGEVSEPVKTSVGYHFIRLERIFPPEERTFEQVKGPMIERLEQQYRAEKLNEYIESMGPSSALKIDEDALTRIIEAAVSNE